MSIIDKRSKITVVSVSDGDAIGGNNRGQIIDTKGQTSLKITSTCRNYDFGIYVFGLEESDDPAFTTFNGVAADRASPPFSVLDLTSNTVLGDELPVVGVISTKRYIRPNYNGQNVGAIQHGVEFIFGSDLEPARLEGMFNV